MEGRGGIPNPRGESGERVCYGGVFRQVAYIYIWHGTNALQVVSQELARGPAAKDLEMAVERLMQGIKQAVAGHVSKHPEKVYANDHLLALTLDRAVAGNASLQAFKTLHLEDHFAKGAAGAYDTAQAGCVLLGSGKRPRSDVHADIKGMLFLYFETSQPDDWEYRTAPGGGLDSAFASRGKLSVAVLVYSAAECNDGERILAMSNGKATSRVNYWVIVQYLEGAAQVAVPYVTLVKFFVRVADPHTGLVARFAIVDRYARKPMCAGKPAGRDGRAHVAHMSQLVHRDYAVPITQVQRKLCCAFEMKYMEGTMYFMETLVQTTRT